jgi:hypothetical protein
MSHNSEFFDYISTTQETKPTIPPELLPHYRLILSIIVQAVVDKDWEWLKSEACAKYCHLIGVNPEAIKIPKKKIHNHPFKGGFTISE